MACILARMRTLALSLVIGMITLTSSCQTTYSNETAWDQQQKAARAPQGTAVVAQPGGAMRTGLVPSRALSTPRVPPPAPDCAAVCVVDPRTGRVLYAYNAHARRQVASTQKIVTALCVCDMGNLNKQVTIAPEDLKAPPIRLNLKPGTSYSRGDLLRVMLTGSYNDVALTLARDAAGSVEAFVNRMNARARRMRMYNTHFANPNGLPAEQYSTAYDMALAACYAYSNPIIRRCINIPQYNFRLADGRLRKVESTNKLLGRYPWVQGMKTGYTNAAGKCLISCASLRGQSVIVVVLGSTSTKIWGESMKYLRWALNANF